MVVKGNLATLTVKPCNQDLISSFHLQKPTVEERVRSSGENRLDIQSILTIPAVDLADTGNISCTGTNEAGVNSSTTYLLVVGKPQKPSPAALSRIEMSETNCLTLLIRQGLHQAAAPAVP